MAERPIFIPCVSAVSLFKEVPIEFAWHPGFAAVQKQKNVAALHEAAAKLGYSPVLEISTKSDRKLGVRMSAFNLMVGLPSGRSIPLECAFQGSKVFEGGGPFHDIYSKSSREAKKDERLKGNGRIVGFDFDGTKIPSEPRTAFYDWLYVRALAPHREFLSRLEAYSGFSDIEFNPNRSLNCQARSAAIFVSLCKRDLLSVVVDSPDAFITFENSCPPLVEPDQTPVQLELVEPPNKPSVIVGSCPIRALDVPFVNDPPTLEDMEKLRLKMNELILHISGK